jgi:hypothetical protein
MSKKRNQLIKIGNDHPPTETRNLAGYLQGDSAERSAASEGLYEQVRPLIDRITRETLRSRFRLLTEEAIQEAWKDCLGELEKRGTEFLQSRDARPAFRDMVVALTMRAVWRLEKRARVEAEREVSLDAVSAGSNASIPQSTRMPPSHEPPTTDPSGTPVRRSSERDSDMEPDMLGKLSIVDFHRIFTLSWEELLRDSTDEHEQVLNDIGALAFFADDWVSLANGSGEGDVTPRTMTRVVLERRQRVRVLVDVILERDHRLDARARKRFLDVLVPVPV